MRKKSYDKIQAKAADLYEQLNDDQRKQFAILGISGCLAAKKDVLKVALGFSKDNDKA